MLCPVCSMLKVLKSSSFALFACSGLNVASMRKDLFELMTFLIEAFKGSEKVSA